ncbi:MAG: hypothetical protein ACT4PT_04085 [Methanobacteriota archaeon]
MRLEFEVELPDAPGELSKVLSAVAKYGGNILSVVHRHEAAVGGRVPVAISIDIPEEAALRVIDGLARTHRLLRVNREGGPVRTTILLVGHVFEAGLTPLLDAVFETGTEVSEVDARIAGRANPSAALLRLTAEDPGALERGVSMLREKAGAKGIQIFEQAWEG